MGGAVEGEDGLEVDEEGGDDLVDVGGEEGRGGEGGGVVGEGEGAEFRGLD